MQYGQSNGNAKIIHKDNIKNDIFTGLHKINCSYTEIYEILKSTEIPVYLSAIKRIDQCFEVAVDV